MLPTIALNLLEKLWTKALQNNNKRKDCTTGEFFSNGNLLWARNTSSAILEQLRQTEIKSNSHAWLEISRWECDRKRAQVTVVRVFKKKTVVVFMQD